MGNVKVLKPGFYSSVQDTGRRGFASYGVPCSGVMDSISAIKANLLLNNPEEAAVLEITMTGPELLFQSSTSIVVSGAHFDLFVDGKPVYNDKLYTVNAGSVLCFGGLRKGFRSYLGVSGGFKTEKVLESRSMYSGITRQGRIYKDDILKVSGKPLVQSDSLSRINFRESIWEKSFIEVSPGPEFDRLNNKQRQFLQETTFTISPDSNRMAIQFREKLKNDLEDILTGPVVPGTVQLTPSGNLIVLMRDCQVTGGYSRVLQLNELAISSLAQQCPGATINLNLASQ